ncbi:3-oxoacyl-[acyl-carrier-protein] synthase III C-terminal domain-containing protein [Silvanigrella aquatica]|uniref:Chalcone/stilbene synthase C-terminal domain-containing protein n=1 Tax=Silvanigrella aquatica TaxID=1915309 RepID=A0A1L4CX77_9BACT|nr:3-oxoacyl-[acyl-carrier-protein] synthase III C-terminal domain-containing protein [Silvanigrella aquatica]APJ02552.1 hypothetical protein AXG55_00825 [Silvanigrella aquatica]
MRSIISSFRILRPNYEVSQEVGLQWISRAHAYAKYLDSSSFVNKKTIFDLNILMENITNRFACKPDKIANRGTFIADYLHNNWEEMQFFDLKKNTAGSQLQERMSFFSEVTNQVFNKFYSDIDEAPQHIIHVTCTGYVSPSAAQLIVANKNWGKSTKVTHAYHMGCYAAFPALRIAQGFLLQDKQLLNSNEKSSQNRVDIVHTELSTLHFNPSLQDPSQFVVQSLFGDGLIYYSLYDKNSFLYSNCLKGLEIIVNHEEIISNSSDAMSWEIGSNSFQMTLSGKVPSMIAENIENFIGKMFSFTDVSFEEVKNNCIFAIHPGGPKIIQHIKDILSLSNESVQLSESILKMYGNMSSATLPHVWDSILNSDIEKGALVVSLAFGPGLTISGSIMRIV